jgi:hypothetical protein
VQYLRLSLSIVGLPLGLLGSCGGGSGGGSGAPIEVSGLAGPSQVSVLTVDQEETPGATPGGLAPGVIDPLAGFDDGADYFTDAVNAYVYDPSMESLGTINMILGMAAQTAYAPMVNQGPYRAQIDLGLIGGQGDGGGNGQSSADVPELQLWTVDSQRSSNQGAQTVHFWVPGDGEGEEEPETIFAELTVTRAADASDPFGQFAIDFASFPESGSIDDPQAYGRLATLPSDADTIGFSFFESEGDLNQVPSVGEFSRLVQSAVEMSNDQVTGSARIATMERYDHGEGDTGLLESEYLIAFDQENVLRQLDGGDPVCLSRTEFLESVWRYNLYHADGELAGQRLELSGGFNFQVDSGAFGWIGYQGMWLPGGVTVDSGDLVTRIDFATGDTTQYEVVRAPGRLIRNLRNTLPLSEVEGETFEWYDFGGKSPANYQVSFDGQQWVRIAQYSYETNAFEALEEPQPIELQEGQWLGMWSSSLGGSVNYVEGASDITYFQQSYVGGDDPAFLNGEILLYGYTEMLGSGITQEQAELGSVFLEPAPNTDTPYLFVFERSDLTLRHDVEGDGSLLTQVGLVEEAAPQSGPFTWGLRSGPMVTDLAGVTTLSDLYSAEEFYVYETGHNPWNQFTGLIEGNEFVSFDPPIQFTYTHSTANDRNGDDAFDGKNYVLNYGGSGDLWGIPSVSLDLDGDEQPDSYVPQFGIADGTLVGPTGTEYVIKAVDLQITLEMTEGDCNDLDLSAATELELPDGSQYVTPTNGAEPTVDGPPAVVAGVVQ